MSDFTNKVIQKLDENIEWLNKQTQMGVEGGYPVQPLATPDQLRLLNQTVQRLNGLPQKTIFPLQTLDRSKMKWDDYLYTFTPCELVENPATQQKTWFKREDYFAPLSNYQNGQQGINGSKLRQAIWLLQQHILAGGSPDIVHGTVMGSPQSPMATAVSRHFGGKTTTVLGATKPSTCMKAGMVEMSAWFGSEFNFVGSGYNTVIQPRCKLLLEGTKPDAYYLEYGITLDHTKHASARLAAFHALGGYQVQNIPDHITDLIIPAGSCNSCTSIFTGLAMYPKPNIKNIWLVGIGPNRLRFIEERLDIIGKELGLPHIRAWTRDYRDNPGFGKDAPAPKAKNLLDIMKAGRQTGKTEMTQAVIDSAKPRFTVHHWDLHSTNWVRYNDLMDYQWGDIELHPRYEGKVMRFVQERAPELLNENTLFWIVGSKPYIEPMKKNCPELGDIPTEVEVNAFNPVKK
ncbi:hypothetical protein NW77_130 [Erwinia phage phiEa2809]|uniref:Pyridoxal-phosphate dependent enzyme n=1 Tax=Erwinia phage phiEa2809 TaxID=1564096 RepID=A0A0A0YXK9_9CAUD|nr:hypothetical protein NW77_130 [Erwinia phage phiEa2809]AIX13138.1 hypothetical protein NW77_130 [Erwinia phage phiEa2809]